MHLIKRIIFPSLPHGLQLYHRLRFFVGQITLETTSSNLEEGQSTSVNLELKCCLDVLWMRFGSSVKDYILSHTLLNTVIWRFSTVSQSYINLYLQGMTISPTLSSVLVDSAIMKHSVKITAYQTGLRTFPQKEEFLNLVGLNFRLIGLEFSNISNTACCRRRQGLFEFGVQSRATSFPSLHSMRLPLL